jgi:hypothetical protein
MNQLRAFILLRTDVVLVMAKDLGFELEDGKPWHKHVNTEGFFHTPASPFKQ